MYLGNGIGESANNGTKIERRIDATWASVRGYSFTFYCRRNARLFLTIRLIKVEKVEAELYVCATWTSRNQDFGSLCTTDNN